MSNDNTSNGPPNDRRGSVTSAAFSNLFNRSNSTSGPGNGNGARRESVSAAAARDQRRRLSVTTLGIGGSPPSATVPFGLRRSSISTTNSESIDESAIEDDEPGKMPVTSPFARRTSFGAQAMRNMRTGQTSPGSDNGYNWAEQLRFRAESSITGHRPAIGSAATTGSPPRGTPHHDRARSVSDMPAPPQQPEVMKPRQPERPKPDHMQERILKGDFYMD